MKIDYQDLSAFIEHVVDKALEQGFALRSISDLHRYLDENPNDSIKIIQRK